MKEDIRAALQKRISTDDEWDYGVNQCWNEEIEILSRNINDTIAFFENECTADEFSWLSEVFEQVARKTQSHTFVDCLYRIAKKYPNECAKYHIDFVIQCADGAIEDK